MSGDSESTWAPRGLLALFTAAAAGSVDAQAKVESSSNREGASCPQAEETGPGSPGVLPTNSKKDGTAALEEKIIVKEPSSSSGATVESKGQGEKKSLAALAASAGAPAKGVVLQSARLVEQVSGSTTTAKELATALMVKCMERHRPRLVERVKKCARASVTQSRGRSWRRRLR